MDRLVFAALLIALLLLIPARGCVSPDAVEETQSVFFSMLFPQLAPDALASDTEGVEATAAEATYL